MAIMDPNSRALLSSPRTVEACKRLGYDPEELVFKTEHELKIQMGDINVAPDVLELRWKAFEENRKKKVANVMEERRNVIEEFSNKKMRYA